MYRICGKKYNIDTKELYLTNKSISFIPNEICNLKKLEILYLSCNNIIDIPSEIFNITSLKILILSDNMITIIPSDIRKLINLEKLWLNGNKIKVLPRELIELQYIVGLYMNNNMIEEIPKELGTKLYLEDLIFCKNNISSIPIEIINCRQLKSLWLQYNPISDTNDRNVEMIVDMIHSRYITMSHDSSETLLDKIVRSCIRVNKVIDGECICCTSNHNDNVNLLALGCHDSHVICSNCIILLKNTLCPYCRNTIQLDKIKMRVVL